jgi:hypothetical protein
MESNLESNYSVFLNIDIFGTRVHYHVGTDSIGAAFACTLADDLLKKVDLEGQRPNLKLLLGTAHNKDLLRESFFCSILKDNREVEDAGSLVAHEVTNAIWNKKEAICS